MPKPPGSEHIKTVQGLEIYVTQEPAKTERGKDRIWITVNQANPKKWRVAASLCYAKGFNILFDK